MSKKDSLFLRGRRPRPTKALDRSAVGQSTGLPQKDSDSAEQSGDYGSSAKAKKRAPHALAKHMKPAAAEAAAAGLACPMPGTLLRFEADVGATVEAGEPLAVVEAMKMQNVLRAEARVVVDELLADVGDVVAADQMLMTFVIDSET